MLQRQRVPTAKKRDKLWKLQKQGRKHQLQYQILCKGCGEAFPAALARAKYCRKACKWRTESRERKRMYVPRICELCSRSIISRGDTIAKHCLECTRTILSHISKVRPRSETGMYLPKEKQCFD